MTCRTSLRRSLAQSRKALPRSNPLLFAALHHGARNISFPQNPEWEFGSTVFGGWRDLSFVRSYEMRWAERLIPGFSIRCLKVFGCAEFSNTDRHLSASVLSLDVSMEFVSRRMEVMRWSRFEDKLVEVSALSICPIGSALTS